MTTLEELVKKRNELSAKIQQIKARESAKNRAEDTRRKILIGGFVLAQLKKKEAGVELFSYDTVRFFDTLVNARDRALFGLEPLTDTSVLSPAPDGGGDVA